MIMNDYVFKIEETEENYIFTATRGSEVQTMILPRGGGKGNVKSEDIENIVVMDRADYDALPEKSPSTLYLIRG